MPDMQRPNIIFILIDDLGWKDLGCYGSSFYETPNLDSLADSGMRFTNAYAACPVCSPTRASILSGKYPAAVGVTDWIPGNAVGRLFGAPYSHHLPLEEKSLASALRDGGYRTWHAGKWHLGERPYYPDKHGFDVNLGGCEWGLLRNGFFSPWGLPTLEDGPEGQYMPDRLADEVIRLIEAEDDRPFFLNLCFYAVHTPIQAKPQHIEKYREKAKAMGLDGAKTFEEGEFFSYLRNRERHVLRRLLQSDAVYAAMIHSLDENIGRILKSLEDTTKADNTIVFFTSDNGGLSTAEGSPTCNSPLAQGKGWMYEGGTREPLIVRWPGVAQPGSICDVPVTSPDFYPTVLEMAGLGLIPQQHSDGISLQPLLRQTGTLDQRAIYWHFPHYANEGGLPGSSIRCDDYKLIEFFEDGRLELYNLRNDLGEEHDLAGDEPGVRRDLEQMLKQWREEVGAKIPQPNPNYPSG